MKKILCLDHGDQWIGTALSDVLGFTAKPYQTIVAKDINAFIERITTEKAIEEIVIGYPLTLRGTQSEQTKKTIAFKETLEKNFPNIRWVLWDERLTSKQADSHKRAKTKLEKIEAHSIAAAFILQTYLDYRYLQKGGTL